MRGDYYKTGIGLTTGFIRSHTITVYTLHNSLLQLQLVTRTVHVTNSILSISEDCLQLLQPTLMASLAITSHNWLLN
jgi:hypothetical protein